MAKKKYRSKFEEDVAQWFKKNKIKVWYEPCTLEYLIPESKHRYTPDWQIDKEYNIYYETKGKLDLVTQKKLRFVKEQHPHIKIRIIFQNSKVKIRKNSPTTYGMWADKFGFEWCDFKKGIPKTWIKTKE